MPTVIKVNASKKFIAAVKAEKEASKKRHEKIFKDLDKALIEVELIESGEKKPISFNKFLKDL